MQIAIIGATGNVGRKVVGLLLQRDLAKPTQLRLFASPKSAGKTLCIENHAFSVEATHEALFKESQICIFNTENEVSSEYIPLALAAGAYVIDSSSHYRLHADVPLIIPPVNRHLISKDKKLYAHANCLASPIATVLAPLEKAFGVKRVNAVTYQSTSGAGKNAMDECWLETKSVIHEKAYERSHFKRQIAFNIIPQVGDLREDGNTSEEYKISQEVRKVVGNDILITSTAVRVPVMIGHSIALNLELRSSFELSAIIEALKKADSVKLSEDHYSTPIEVEGSDEVWVGRLRKDQTIENGLHLWLCSDNLRRGAAVDTVEILSSILALV